MHGSFLQSIIESPDDDGPRLIYADWLDEHGDSDRAEFIRVQCAVARMPASDSRLRKLRSNKLDDDAAEVFATSSAFPNLTLLDLRNNRIGSKAADALRERFGRKVKLSVPRT
jgi:uncharacterized protein (TIGR02996 family)